jgi:hypothetical protein
MTELLFRVVAPHFVAGIVVVGGRIVEAAPIIRYMVGWNGAHLVRYCRSKGWAWESVPQ